MAALLTDLADLSTGDLECSWTFYRLYLNCVQYRVTVLLEYSLGCTFSIM